MDCKKYEKSFLGEENYFLGKREVIAFKDNFTNIYTSFAKRVYQSFIFDIVI